MSNFTMSQKDQLAKFGITMNAMNHVDTLEELKTKLPLVVIATIETSGNFKSGNYTRRFNKGEDFVLTISDYLNNRKNNGIKYLKPSKKKFRNYFKRYNGEDLTNKKLLVWRSGGFGDLLFSQPLLQYIKKTYPGVHITYATAMQHFDILGAFPDDYIDAISSFPFPLTEMEKADYHLTFEGSIERCEEAKRENSYDLFKRMANLDFNVKDYKPRLVVKQELVDEIKPLIPENKKYVVLQMMSSTPIRMMNFEKWGKIINLLFDRGYLSVAIDSPSSSNKYDEFKKTMNLDGKLINLSYISKSLEYAIAAIDKSEGVIGIDSSFIHVANALDKPSVGLYGPFKGDLRMRYYDRAFWFEEKEYSGCNYFPCFFHSGDSEKCPSLQNNRAPGCMDRLNEEEIVNKMIELITNK